MTDQDWRIVHATGAHPDRVNLTPSPIAAQELLDEPNEDAMGTTDCPEGCYVEPDGHCPHGYASAGLTAGLI